MNKTLKTICISTITSISFLKLSINEDYRKKQACGHYKISYSAHLCKLQAAQTKFLQSFVKMISNKHGSPNYIKNLKEKVYYLWH
jgi:hypothetical protein